MVKRIGLTLGFTLIEMAIVLVVIGLLLSGGLTAIAPVIQNSKISETNQKLDRIEQALILHVIRYSCLPCPATGTGTAGQADAGGVYIGCPTAPTACTNAQGVVPWINLGLSEADITDGFGNRISYAIGTTANLQNNGEMLRVPPSGYPAGDLPVSNLAGTPITTSAARLRRRRLTAQKALKAFVVFFGNVTSGIVIVEAMAGARAQHSACREDAD